MKAKKQLGQHFLTAEGITERISAQVLRYAEMLKNRHVLEVGPGMGALTSALLEKGLTITAVEFDQDMITELEIKFKNEIQNNRLRLICSDILDLESGVLENMGEYVVCGNLPYNVGSEIVFRFLENEKNAKAFVFMLQKEVVLRFISTGGDADFGVPALKMQLSTEQEGHFWVKPGSFSPPPKVDSGVFFFKRKSNEEVGEFSSLVRGSSYDRLAKMASGFFQHRRKMMRAVDKRLRGTKWESQRPQELSLEDFVNLLKILENSKP